MSNTGRVLTCVYCGHQYPQDTPAAGHKVLTDHIAQCDKHPMRAVIQQRDLLRRAMVGLVGTDGKPELEAMEAQIRMAPAPEADKAGIVNAIHALVATLPTESEGAER